MPHHMQVTAPHIALSSPFIILTAILLFTVVVSKYPVGYCIGFEPIATIAFRVFPTGAIHTIQMGTAWAQLMVLHYIFVLYVPSLQQGLAAATSFQLE